MKSDLLDEHRDNFLQQYKMKMWSVIISVKNKMKLIVWDENEKRMEFFLEKYF